MDEIHQLLLATGNGKLRARLIAAARPTVTRAGLRTMRLPVLAVLWDARWVALLVRAILCSSEMFKTAKETPFQGG